MELNREKLKRMFEDTKGNGGSANGGGGGGSLAGYATQAWVNEGFVSIDFFNRLFTVYGPGETSSDPDVVIEPNDLESTIKNIKAMFGLWTEQYLSALGLNPGGTGSATSLSMLDDVDITTPTNGQALVYNSTSLKWENQTISTVTSLANLTDVVLTSPANHEFLMYDGVRWINSAIKTINGQSLYGSGDISVGGGASGNYLPLSGGTMTGPIHFTTLQAMPQATDILKSFVVVDYFNKGGTLMWMSLSDVKKYIVSSGTKKVWGRAYYYSSEFYNVTGDMSDVGNITMNGTIQMTAPTYTTILMDLCSYPDNPYGFFVISEADGSINLQSQRRGTTTEFFSLGLNSKGGNVGVGTTTPSYKLHVAGTIYATGEITALSDINQKNIKEYMQLGIDEVANAPIIKFTWKDPKAEDKGLQVGSIAQYWEKVLPEAVKKDKEGTLSMSYGVVALVAAISTAKKVQEHERRIADLERENKELKVRLRRLNRYGKQ